MLFAAVIPISIELAVVIPSTWQYFVVQKLIENFSHWISVVGWAAHLMCDDFKHNIVERSFSLDQCRTPSLVLLVVRLEPVLDRSLRSTRARQPRRASSSLRPNSVNIRNSNLQNDLFYTPRCQSPCTLPPVCQPMD